MELGICTRYTRHEATFAAIRLANAATSRGVDTSLFTMTHKPGEIDSKWDRRVVCLRDQPFVKWAESRRHILWTTLPSMPQVAWVNSQGKKSSLFLLWHELDANDRQVLSALHQIICPHRACFELLRSWGLRNCICIPWDCGMPLYAKPSNYLIEQPKLLLPLWDGNARRTEMTVVDIVRLALARHDSVTVTVVCNSSTISAGGCLRLNKLASKFKQRLRIQRNVHPACRFKLFQSHDLTLWPSHFENTCMTALQSIEMGTPVMAFNFSPADELLTQYNSITVPCLSEHNVMGMPRAVPDYDGFDDMLHQVLRDPGFLRTLQGTTMLGIQQRRDLFDEMLGRVLH